MEDEMGKLGQKLKKWSQETVVDVKAANERVESILNEQPKSFQSLSLKQLEIILMFLSQYIVFLSNELSKAKSLKKYFQTKFNDRLARIMSSQTLKGKSKDERMLEARKSDKQLSDIFYLMEEQVEKEERLEAMPIALNTYLSTIKNVYFRKQSEAKKGSNRYE